MATDPRRAVGALGERLAECHLRGAGYRVLARNYRTRFGELDLIAAGDDCLIFCEVKTRVSGTVAGPAGPLDAIGREKRRRLRMMAGQWLSEQAGARRDRPTGLRFDAIGVTLRRSGELASLEHVEDAFS